MPNSSMLAEKIKAMLTHEAHFDLQRSPLQIDDLDGTVVVRGVVETLREKRRAEQLMMRVEGLRALRSELRVAPVIERTDEEVELRVRDAFTVDRSIDETTIDVRVADGVVTISGVVATPMQRRLAAATVWWLPGVQDVVDVLRVRYPEDDGDEDIKEACHLLLDKDPLVDSSEVSVLCQDGEVTLAGAVASDVQRDAAEDTIWGIEGVIEVLNHLVVVPGVLPPSVRGY